MSETAAHSALSRMNLKTVLIDPTACTIASDLSKLSAVPEGHGDKLAQSAHRDLCEAYGFNVSTQTKPFAYQDGVAVIPIHGSLINRFGQCYGWITGYNFIRRQRDLAMADPDVQLIVYDVNSPGGEAAGCFELSDEMFALRGKKPTMAIVDSSCYSAAYALASAADKVVVIPSGGAGSIGAYRMHVDVSKALDNMGMKVTLISSGDHKVDGHPFAPLPDAVRADMQVEIDRVRGSFVSLVARNRAMSEEDVKNTEARCYNANEALALGLIDSVASPLEAITAFLGGDAANSDEEEQPMTDTEKAEARKAERERIAAITGSEQAKGREGFAQHLAMNTEHTAEECIALLAASPVAVAPVAAPAAATTPVETPAVVAAPVAAPAAATTPVETPAVVAAPAANPAFTAAMNNGQNPNITPDGADAGEESASQGLMSAFTEATGYSFE